MPVFQYTARSEMGSDNTGAIFAPNEDALYQTLRRQGMFLLRSRILHGRSLRSDRLRISAKQKLAFTIHVFTYVQAGIALMQTLQSLARESFGVKFQTMVDGIINQISNGSSFSAALMQYPCIFDKHYIQMISAGETAGQLDARMEELVRHLEWQQEIRSQIKQSSTYPVIIIGLLFGVVVLLMTFTLPKFVKLLEQFNTQLPAPTRMIIAITNAFSDYWFLLPLIPAIPLSLYLSMRGSKWGRYRLDQWKLKIPFLGVLQRKIAMSRFAHNFSCLYTAGIDTISALKIVEELVGNLVISTVIQRAQQGIAAGKSLTQLFSQSGEFPNFVIQMLAAGEESGNIEATLKKISQYYDREIPIAIKRAFSIVEPLILVIMGGLVVFIALAILLPIYEFGAAINR